MADKGEKKIIEQSLFGRLSQYLNPTTPKGKRNVVILCYALGFLGLHAIWAHSKRSRNVKLIADEDIQTKRV